jgi:hypothetical protein
VPGFVDVHALERRGEAVGIALAPLLAVADDVDACALLVADGDERRVVLCAGQVVLRHAPQLARADARWQPIA